MGQKVNPHGLRVGIIKDWDSKWYAEKDFADYLVEDHEIRTYLKKRLYSAGVSRIEIERASDRVKVVIYTAKPGVVIGKGGAEIEITKQELTKLTDKKVMEFMQEFFPVTPDMPEVQRKNNLRLLEDMRRRYWDAPDLSNVGKNGYRFVNAIRDFATHADPIRKTRNYNENLFLRTVEGNPMIDKAYKLALAAA